MIFHLWCRLTSRNISFDVRELIQLHRSVKYDDTHIQTAQPREAEDDDRNPSEEDYHSISSAPPYKSEQGSIDVREQIGPKSFALSGSAAANTTSMENYSTQQDDDEENDDFSSNQATSRATESNNVFKSIFWPLLRS